MYCLDDPGHQGNKQPFVHVTEVKQATTSPSAAFLVRAETVEKKTQRD